MSGVMMQSNLLRGFVCECMISIIREELFSTCEIMII